MLEDSILLESQKVVVSELSYLHYLGDLRVFMHATFIKGLLISSSNANKIFIFIIYLQQKMVLILPYLFKKDMGRETILKNLISEEEKKMHLQGSNQCFLVYQPLVVLSQHHCPLPTAGKDTTSTLLTFPWSWASRELTQKTVDGYGLPGK